MELLGTVGEPINPAAWKWLYEVVGDSRCAIVDTFWQTETVGFGCTTGFLEAVAELVFEDVGTLHQLHDL